ncbi:MAG TPA: Ig domain-containing protein [Bryobacteraceae bacterium]|nr:Ig domain-containing protein [Bryobacteraceae bacterium]
MGSASEVASVQTGSAITPTVAPSGLAGKVVVNGTGSVNFVAGSGVYFLNCCANTNNAYFKFTGAALAGVFGIPQGQISFTLKSHYTFAQRQSTAAAQRYAFDARDGSGLHQFYFYTQVVSGALVFYYGVGGTALSYTVPKGTEDQLFGTGVSLNVLLGWNGSMASLYLNDVPVKSAAYVPATSTWNGSSNFDLGAYEYLTSGGYNVLDDTIGNFSVASPALLLIHSTSSEVTGTTNGSVVTPSTAPSSLPGKVVVNGSGSVNFVAGSGVYFLNCCANTNNAYFKFTGAALAGVFGIPQGQISFTLKSRYTFAQRQSNSNQRYVFDARDGGGVHQFFFYTEAVSGSLVFYYQVGGKSLYYYVPKGTENTLFGNGVSLNVLLAWNGSTANLYLNGVLVKSDSYVPATSTWNASSNFDFGAYEYLTSGGYNSSDDLIRDFAVIGLPTKPGGSLSSGIALPGLRSGRTPGTRGSGSLSSTVSAPAGASLVCDSSVTAGSSALCELRLDSAGNPDATAFSLATSSEHVSIPAMVATRMGQTSIHFELLTDADAPQGTIAVEARSSAGVAQASLNVVPADTPALLVPGDQTGTPGAPIRFNILASDRGAHSVFASGLPAGAAFDSNTGTFAWTPSGQDLGVHAVAFTATNSLGLSTSKTVAVKIGPPSQDTTPEILTVGDSNQALVVHAGSSMLAAIPSVRFDGQPARPGDLLSISVAGVDCSQASVSGNLQVRFGSSLASIQSVQPAGGTPAVCRITVEVPAGVTAPRTPVSLEMAGQNGNVLSSNTASIATEN